MRTRRKMRMLSSVSMIIGTFLIFSGLLMALTGVTLAAGFTIVGDAEGLRVQPVGASWFEDVDNLGPGDTKESEILLKNEGEQAFDVSMSLRRIDSLGEFDLLEQLIMTVTYRGDDIYHGTMKNFPELDLGTIPVEGEETIKFVVHFLEETGNDYQDTSATVQLVFKAEKEDRPPVIPERPVRPDEDEIDIEPEEPGVPGEDEPEEPGVSGEDEDDEETIEVVPELPRTGGPGWLLVAGFALLLFGLILERRSRLVNE